MVGNKIRCLREARGISQRELGRLTGVSAAAVYKWEHGRAQPDIPKLQIMAKLFGVSMDELTETTVGEVQADDPVTITNIAVMTRAFRQMTPDEQAKMLQVGRTLFERAFGEEHKP